MNLKQGVRANDEEEDDQRRLAKLMLNKYYIIHFSIFFFSYNYYHFFCCTFWKINIMNFENLVIWSIFFGWSLLSKTTWWSRISFFSDHLHLVIKCIFSRWSEVYYPLKVRIPLLTTRIP
jgi:hypothetical protein